MISYRTFRNSDLPALVAIWRSQPPQRGLAQPMTIDLFDQLVLAKPYFDQQGFVVAVHDGELVGFVHAGFGPAEDGRPWLSYDLGTTYLLMVRASDQQQGIAASLLARSEQYLAARGAKVVYGGGVGHLNAFYLGLYGGSELPGVLESSPRALQVFKSAGYEAIDQTVVLQRELAAFRTPVDRVQLQLRRRAAVSVTIDPPPDSWWDACTFGAFDTVRFDLALRDVNRTVARACFWDMSPLTVQWGISAVGLYRLEVDQAFHRQGMGTFLVAESLRYWQQQRVARVEVQTMVHNAAALALYRKLGFQQVDTGVVLRKATRA